VHIFLVYISHFTKLAFYEMTVNTLWLLLLEKGSAAKNYLKSKPVFAERSYAASA